MVAQLRVGLLGYGVAGRTFHAPLIQSIPGLLLGGVVTNAPRRRDLLRVEHPEVSIFDTAEDLLESELDLVIIATPTATHASLALMGIDAGIPVVVDKPIAQTAAEARRMIAEADKRSVPLTVFHNRRWDGDYLTVRRLVDEKKLGDIYRFEARWEFKTRLDPERQGGGLLHELGVHLIDQAIQICGPVDAVYAELARRRPGADVDDDVFLALTHTSGVRSHLWANATTDDVGPRFRILGDNAAFQIRGLDGQEQALVTGRRPGDPGWGTSPESSWGQLSSLGKTISVPTERGGYENFYRILESALRTGSPLPVDPRSAVDALEVIDAAIESAETGKVSKLIQ